MQQEQLRLKSLLWSVWQERTHASKRSSRKGNGKPTQQVSLTYKNLCPSTPILAYCDKPDPESQGNPAPKLSTAMCCHWLALSLMPHVRIASTGHQCGHQCLLWHTHKFSGKLSSEVHNAQETVYSSCSVPVCTVSASLTLKVLP